MCLHIFGCNTVGSSINFTESGYGNHVNGQILIRGGNDPPLPCMICETLKVLLVIEGAPFSDSPRAWFPFDATLKSMCFPSPVQSSSRGIRALPSETRSQFIMV